MRIVDCIVVSCRAVHTTCGTLLDARQFINATFVNFFLLVLVQIIFQREVLARVKLAATELDFVQFLLRLIQLPLVILAEELLFEKAQVLAQHTRLLPLEAHVCGHCRVRILQLL